MDTDFNKSENIKYEYETSVDFEKETVVYKFIKITTTEYKIPKDMTISKLKSLPFGKDPNERN